MTPKPPMTWRDVLRRLGLALILGGLVILLFAWLLAAYPHPLGR